MGSWAPRPGSATAAASGAVRPFIATSLGLGRRWKPFEADPLFGEDVTNTTATTRGVASADAWLATLAAEATGPAAGTGGLNMEADAEAVPTSPQSSHTTARPRAATAPTARQIRRRTALQTVVPPLLAPGARGSRPDSVSLIASSRPL
jgi:hypothetical protein